MKKIYILSTIWMAFIVGACDYNDKGNYIHLYSITLVKGCKRILY